MLVWESCVQVQSVLSQPVSVIRTVYRYKITMRSDQYCVINNKVFLPQFYIYLQAQFPGRNTVTVSYNDEELPSRIS